MYEVEFVRIKIREYVRISQATEVIKPIVYEDGEFNSDGVFTFFSKDKEVKYMLDSAYQTEREEMEAAEEFMCTCKIDLLNGYCEDFNIQLYEFYRRW
jgi:hypothetical protein